MEHEQDHATAAQLRLLEAGGARGGALDAPQGGRGGARGGGGGGPRGAQAMGMGAHSLPGNHPLAANALLNQQYLALPHATREASVRSPARLCFDLPVSMEATWGCKRHS
jgi:hypothetical protein